MVKGRFDLVLRLGFALALVVAFLGVAPEASSDTAVTTCFKSVAVNSTRSGPNPAIFAVFTLPQSARVLGGEFVQNYASGNVVGTGMSDVVGLTTGGRAVVGAAFESSFSFRFTGNLLLLYTAPLC